MTYSTTFFMLLAEFSTGHIPVDKCCHYFGMGADEAKRAAARQTLPVKAFRLGSQKSPWVVAADDLATHIDAKRAAAERDWKKVNDAA